MKVTKEKIDVAYVRSQIMAHEHRHGSLDEAAAFYKKHKIPYLVFANKNNGKACYTSSVKTAMEWAMRKVEAVC
jgi:hypothetical protein